MTDYKGPERRENARIQKNFVVSYRLYGDPDNVDISQTKNIGEGGMFLTTNRSFSEGTILAIEIRLPFTETPIRLLGKIVASREVVPDLIYETHLKFNYMDVQSKDFMKNSVNYFIKKDEVE